MTESLKFILLKMLGGNVRKLLTAIGAFLIGRSVVEEADWLELTAEATPILVALLWGWFSDLQQLKKLVAARRAPALATDEDIASRAAKVTVQEVNVNG